MADAKGAAQQVKILRRTAISPQYIKADEELHHAATQYLIAIAALADRTQLVEEANAKLKKKLVPKFGFDGKVDWRVVADARVKGGLIIEEIEKEPAS